MGGIPHDDYTPNSAAEKWIDQRLPIVRLGYQTLAVIEEYVGPFHRHIMLKRLSGAETADAHALAAAQPGSRA